MNILISTTTGWNIGDEFIRMGVQHLLEQVVENPTYIFYDRNPDYFIDYPGNWEMGSNHFSNRMNNPIDWDIIDLVVLAGSPEFLHGPLTPIYEGLKTRPHIPLWAIGVGYSNRKLAPLTEAESIVLARDNTIITVRQEDIKDKLPKSAHYLPCPAIFCIDKLQGIPSFPSEETAVILQAPEGNQAISEELYNKMLTIPGDKMVHYIDDFVFLTKRGIKAYYEPDPYIFLTKLKKYSNVHTTRLHGAIAGLSNWANVSIHYDENNHRIKQAIKPFEPILNQPRGSEGLAAIRKFKYELKEQYIDILKKHC